MRNWASLPCAGLTRARRLHFPFTNGSSGDDARKAWTLTYHTILEVPYVHQTFPGRLCSLRKLDLLLTQ